MNGLNFDFIYDEFKQQTTEGLDTPLTITRKHEKTLKNNSCQLQ